MPYTRPSLFVAGNVLTAAQLNEFREAPLGIIAISSAITSAFTTTGTHTNFQDVTGFSVSTTYLANRNLRVTVQTAPYPSGGTNDIVLKVLRGSTDIASYDITQNALATGFAYSHVFSTVFAGPSTGATETFKLQIRGTSNTAVSNNASAAYPGRIYVEDLGPV